MKDLSKELRSWAAEKKLGEFETAEMHKTRIDSLKVRLGRPYVYLHQGNCEHIILFSDIRLLDSSDPNRFSLFPKIHCTGRLYGKHCMMCSDFYARWLVVGNERLTHDKAYLCNKCFISYNYVNGKKVGNFRAYKYVDPVAIL
ncbi:hypothetical protein RUM43_011730 [Polyplax serrata]|uniref:snRNA-activating protein complex subunit 3 n=2 Tax=Polyplax serrata TaxID=468196 RepID=A0AAN8Q3A3_POLSC